MNLKPKNVMKTPNNLKVSLMFITFTLLMGACTNAQEKKDSITTEVKVFHLGSDEFDLNESESAALAKALKEVEAIIGAHGNVGDDLGKLPFNLDSLLGSGDAVSQVQVITKSSGTFAVGDSTAQPTFIVIEDGKITHSGAASGPGKTEVRVYHYPLKKE